MGNGNTQLDRRSFLKRTSAAAGAASIAATAGCLGGENGGDSDIDYDDEEDAGEPFPEYTFYNNPQDYNPQRHDLINLIAEQWQEVGFDVEVEVLEWATLLSRVSDEYEFDFAAWSQYQSPDPAENVADRWSPEHAEEPGRGNYNQYQNDRVGELIDEQLAAEEMEGRVDAFHEIQDILAEDAPFSPVCYETQLIPYRTDELDGWVEHPAGPDRIHQYANVEPMDQNEDGYLRGFWTEALENLNSWSHEGLSKHLHIQDAIQLRVAQVDADLELDPEHGLAQDIERPDETTIRFEIRDDVEWSDGEPLTPDDVAFTYNTIAEQEPSTYTTVSNYVEGASVDGDWVEVDLSQEIGRAALLLIGYEVYVAAEHVWEGTDPVQDELVEEPVCSGPMEVDYWDVGQGIELETRDDHPIDLAVDGLFWEIIPESSTIWSYTEDGTINYHPFAQPGLELQDGEEEIDDFEVFEAPGDGWTHLNINTTSEGLDEVAVRQALVHALPKEAASEQLFYGYMPVAHSYVAPAFGPLHREHEDLPFTGEGTIAAAASHLQENGYVVTEDGVYYSE
ncbi:ABC-type transport system periplasmic substrate-binding protein (probable substrate dipeptide/oligopeptide) (plasmid) [Natrialba magadii ATCC 43099]|uniref:ABC-type transport system periplasmic substrate-binding protein (Probable substrate dipeptide/oligopeptide) n=1 Tax=Natrialba magadii (strain ATCC 43099 / DSM 3394 / CCM 3739 / CIP 104546 / IAM 13178 / JCM 8861 / NBRC 102185 / NCIMB 2190 / MS3) TaxID=547559 RepID=D3T1S0_NATMM|nr:ABC transporter substrate-binding protein [Natrialba magadii]ADD07529.1 ABC-type transport system periplasmic substrate-binding protein (probable substrate dipeptide/oligopeptide) [Natrialba magadii ATCC 43099]ELY26565.1 family 5 extracellular solute-binding protein [Natrialba magadii ATCC 43099]